MILAAARYAFPNARVRGLRGRRLSERDMHFLVQAQDLAALLEYLSTTSYGEVLPPLEHGMRIPAALERSLARPLLQDYARVFRALGGRRQRAVVKALFSRYEAENLKLLLRARRRGLSRRDVSHLEYLLGQLSTLAWEALWSADGVREIAEVLGRSPFGRALRHALPEFEAGERLFTLEMALEIAALQQLEEVEADLPRGADRRHVRHVLGPYVDALNCLWVSRLKVHYGLSPEEVVNYSLPGGEWLTLPRLHHLARAEDLEQFLERVPPAFRKATQGLATWSDLRPRLEAWLAGRLSRVFVGPPFHLGVELAYLLEKEVELSRLVSLIQAKSLGLSPGDTVARMERRLPESAHV